MIEIKFRAWDKVGKKMWKVFSMKFFGEKGDFDLQVEGNEDEEWEEEPDFVTMQNIGLKDMKGKDIYEGDILQDVKMIKIRKELAIYEIVFLGGSFCLKGSEETIPIFAYDGNSLDNMEIIGNIYENLD